MEDIAKMADECLKDIDDEDDGNIEDDQDLLVFIAAFNCFLKAKRHFRYVANL